MKVEFHIKDVIISAKQKALIEKKLYKLKRYIKDEPLVIDCYFKDETSAEKGGVDQSVELSATFGSEKIFVKETNDRLMRSFAISLKAMERKLSEFHKKRIDKSHRPKVDQIDRVLRALRLRR